MALVTTESKWGCTHGTVAGEHGAIGTISHSTADLSGALPHNLSEPQQVSQALEKTINLLAWVK